MTSQYDKAALMGLVRKLALQIGQFKLASGKLSSYYLDCRKVTLDSAGANLIADGMLELLGNDLPDGFRGRRTCGIEKVVRTANLQIRKKYFSHNNNKLK